MFKFLIRFLISLIPVIPLYFIAKELLWIDIKIFWFLSYYYLIFVLLVTPISKILLKFKKSKKYSNKIINYRRPIWIITGILSILHLINFEEKIQNFWSKFYSEEIGYLNFILDGISSGWWENVFWMGFYSFWIWVIAYIIMLALLFTSNNISQRILWAKVWKYLQKLIYPLFILVIIHIYLVWWFKEIYLYPWIFLILLRSYVWFDERYEKKWNNNKWNSKYKKFLCLPCWFIYDEELWDEDWWLAPWTKFEDIPNDWECPVCWVTKKDFIPLDNHYNPQLNENHELDFIVDSKIYLTDDVIEIIFLCKRDLEIQSWQFCNLLFKKWKNKISRSYSIAKYVDNKLTFLIKLTKDGKWAKELRKLKLWDKVNAIWPYWDFVIQNTSKKKIFIATWTGLSPIFNMMLHSWEIEKELHFWVRNEKDLFYVNMLKNIPNLKIFIYLSWEEIEWYIYWRVNIDSINVWKNDEVYICWNKKLVEQTVDTLKNKQIESVYSEKFL